MPITPDTKDWTWVLERACPECGFDPADVDPADIAGMVRTNSQQWAAILERPDDELRTRPADDRWSALEYACHVRDVFRLYWERLDLMLGEDDPTFANWDQDATAVAERYHEQAVRDVAVQLDAAAERLAGGFERVTSDDWARTGRRSDGAVFTVDTFARYMIHDPIHHLHDVTRGFDEIGTRPS
jgi:uncharacterized damage-inducible protein DinB